MEKNDINKKIDELSKIIRSGKGKEIDSYDTGLLNVLFEPVTGSSEERYSKISDKLVLVQARLIKIYLDEKPENRPSIISEIEEFFSTARLPMVSPNVEDYTQREGRIIQINREDKSYSISCTSEDFNKTIDRITEEQYGVLANQAKGLLGRAVAYLSDSIFPWHKQALLRHLDFER